MLRTDISENYPLNTMPGTFKPRLVYSLLFVSCLLAKNALAWDSVGHRLSAAVANHYLSDSVRNELTRILLQHPRYEKDFLEQMPASIARGNDANQFEWLLGQAAIWPDMTRGLPGSERDKYNRANWHYIDGAWLRGESTIQGNTYIAVAPFDDILGSSAATIRAESNADNVMTALDYNTALLGNTNATMSQRAVALCWVLHLVGDIHQPLHVGSLYSKNRFASGDRGGNGIQTDSGNLHARWDRALRSEGVNTALETLLMQHSATLANMNQQDGADWSVWMQESRALLLNTVYTQQMKIAIARSDSSTGRLREFTLSENYVDAMKVHARLRLALAGRRLALWFEDKL